MNVNQNNSKQLTMNPNQIRFGLPARFALVGAFGFALLSSNHFYNAVCSIFEIGYAKDYRRAFQEKRLSR